jgi:restriction endonuclease S subunit
MSSKTKSTATKEDATPALVPKLRFPEFRGEEGWQQKRLGHTLKFQPGFPFPSAGFNDEGRGLRLIRNRDLRSDDIIIFYSDEFDPSFVVKNGDVLVGMDGDFTPTVWDKGDALLNQRVGRIHPRGDVNRKFILYLLTLSLKRIEELTARTTVKHLSHSVVEERDELVPSPAEQQKIAECLSSLDELMAAQARKVEALKEHKKGLMQQLFPREGESQPRLRFPEFRGKEEWDLTTIGSLGSFYYGKSAPKWSLAEDATTPCVRYGELYTKFGPVITETFSRTNIDPTTLRFSKGGEILVPRVGEKPEDFGKSCSYLPLRDIAIGEMISVFETDQDPLFYTYYFRNLYKQFASVVEGQNVKNLYYVELEPLAIYRPALAEQQKVAECLSSLDELIAAQARKVEALKTHKRGLMQQLFPSPEEVGA